jgi:hypothetical protein
VSSQARVAAAGSVMPMGIATGTGEGLGVSCAVRLFEEQASATMKTAKRTIILRVWRD